MGKNLLRNCLKKGTGNREQGTVNSQLFLIIRRGIPWLIILGLLSISRGVRSENIRQSVSCPTDVKTLTDWMLKDLPGYANRVIQRSKRQSSNVRLSTYVILAGRPEFEPLSLPQNQYKALFPDSTQQVFFTTLDRQYTQNRAIDLQNFHWLFLTQTPNGWQVFTLLSQLASLKSGDPPLPPQDSSNGVIGQAIKLWLRDCEAGALR